MGPADLQDDPLTLNAAAVAQRVPGVAGAYSSIDALEVSMRGLGWERVPAQLDFLPLYGSCPARMDPPATYLSPESIEQMTLAKGLPSVTYGAGGTGGRVMMRTVSNILAPALDGQTGQLSATWNDARDGGTGSAGGRIGNGTTEAGVSVAATDYGDYVSGSGKHVPADNRSHGVSATFRLTPDADNGYFGSWHSHIIDHVDYPALPMDATAVTADTFTFGGHHGALGEWLESVEWQVGYAISDHSMDNALKPNRTRMDAEAVTEAESLGARVASELRFSERHRWTVGIDAHRLDRNGIRTRAVKMGPPPPGSYQDPIWPEAKQAQAGGFAERTSDLGGRGQLRIGLRVDSISSCIDRGDESTPFDATVRDGYARYYGNDARDTDRDELLFSGNVLWKIPHGERVQWFVSGGCVQRAAAITERFYAYAPAPGGLLVGNPTLDPETKSEIDVGMDFFGDHVELGIHAFVSHVEDYILETAIGTTPSGARVRGFVNTDALLGGGELQGRWLLADEWTMPFSVACVYGRNLDDHRDLPRIPPLSGHVGLRYDVAAHRMRPWVETTLRAASGQDQVDPAFGESETPSYQVVDLRAGMTLAGRLALEAGVENLFDQDYSEHLSREVPFAVGDLLPGERIPMPGRFAYARMKWLM